MAHKIPTNEATGKQVQLRSAERMKLSMDWTPPPKHRHAAEDTPSETVPVVDRADRAPNLTLPAHAMAVK